MRGPHSGDIDAYRFQSLQRAREEAHRLARWKAGAVRIVDWHAVERGEKSYFEEIVAP